MSNDSPGVANRSTGKKPMLFALAAIAVGLVVAIVMNPDRKKETVPVQPPAAAPKDSASGQKAGGVPMVSDLLPRLEAKVAANPNDMNLRMLLAQTYDEVGQHDKGMDLMRKLREQFPLNQQVAFVLGAILVKGDAEPDLREALKLFKQSASSEDATLSSASIVYQGKVMVKLGDGKGAAKLWRDYIAKIPQNDVRRKQVESELAKLPPA